MHNRTIEELLQDRDEIRRQWEQNQRDYMARYGNSPANYAASINDDYGDGEEFTRLTLLLHNISAELRQRQSTIDTNLKN